jgi:DnaJ-class molecular chaperone
MLSCSAYEILSDPSKRQMYDQTGNTGEGNAAGFN